MLSWAIGRHADIFSNYQLADLISEKAGFQVDRHTVWAWRNGYGYPENERDREALASTFGYEKYSAFLISTPKQVMGVLGNIALKMEISPAMLRQIRLRQSQQIKLMNQMRVAIDLTGDETAAVGVAVSFWSDFMSIKHPILNLKINLSN